MAKWWIKGKISPMHAIKRGMTSLFVCSVVLLPLVLGAGQVKTVIGMSDGRKASPLAAMQPRAIDSSNSQIKPFDQPLITVTFDDGYETIYTQAAPLLQKYGIPTTQYVLSGVEQDKNYMTFDQIKALQKAGHEIGCHSVDHRNLTTLSQPGLLTELTECKAVVERKTGLPIREFASPFGASNTNTIAAINQTYRSHRNTAGDIINNVADDQDINTRANFNRYQIIGVTLRSDTTVAQLQAAIDYTVKNNGWLVLNYHQVGDSDPSEFALDIKLLESQLQAVNQSKARIVTTGQFLDALQKQEQ